MKSDELNDEELNDILFSQPVHRSNLYAPIAARIMTLSKKLILQIMNYPKPLLVVFAHKITEHCTDMVEYLYRLVRKDGDIMVIKEHIGKLTLLLRLSCDCSAISTGLWSEYLEIISKIKKDINELSKR